jgi:PAP2 superfamily
LHSGRVHNIALTWQQAALVAAGLLILAIALGLATSRRLRTAAPFVRESFVIAALYSVWQLAGTLSVLGTSGAFQRAHDLVRIEHDLHLPSEASVQRAIEGHPLIVQACNVYYATMHFGVLFAFLLWLFVWHRLEYGRIRNLIALVTLVCLLIQLVPVAPPRLLPGYVDTAAQYHQSVYTLGLGADQLSAMPSVHVAWAVLIGWAVVRISTSPWRWLALVHPALTIYVVAATANHFWLDGAVAVAILAACYYLQRGTHAVGVLVIERARTRRTEQAQLSSEPVARILR